jgi:PAS domain S-box-containing protein
MDFLRGLRRFILRSGIIENALRDAEDRFYKVFHASPTAMSLTTNAGRYVDANDALLSILGFRREELVGQSVGELGIWTDRGEREGIVRELVSEGRVRGREGRLRTKSGELREVEISMELIGKGIGSHVLTIVQDVTERKKSEAALRASEERYRAISELVSDFAYSFVVSPQGELEKEWITAAFSRITGRAAEEIETADDLIAFVHPADRAEASAHFAAALRGLQDKRELRILGQDGATRWLRFQTRPVLDPGSGSVVRLYGAAEEISDRVKAYQTLEQRVEERTHELSVLLDVSSTVASTRELEPLLALILNELKKLIDYNGAAIFKLEGDDLVFLDYRGPMPREDVMKLRLPLNKAPDYIKVIMQRAPLIIRDLWEGSQGGSFYQRPAQDLYPVFGYAHSWLGLPLIAKGRLVGLLRLDHRDCGHFTEQHASLAMTMANQAALAIANSELNEKALNMAALEERQRIARELHDSVSQALYGIKLGTQTAIELARKEGAKTLDESLEYVHSLADAGMVEMKALLYELRPEALETEGLNAGLEKNVAALRARHGLDVSLELGSEPKVSLKAKEALYRIAREALNNIVSHAQATKVRLSLTRKAGALDLVVEDDGLGFERSLVAPGHLGLRGMAERAGQLGGTFEVISSPGQGTIIHARIPIGA